MVHLVPEDRNDLEFNNSRGEQTLYKKFKTLSDDFYVFHSMHIPVGLGNYVLDKELDFVVFNPNYGILCIEVKSGNIKYENGRTKQLKRDGVNVEDGGYKTIDPLVQIKGVKYKIINELKKIYPKGFEAYPVISCVWFTDILGSRLCGDLPLNYCNRTLWKDDLVDIEATLITAFQKQGVDYRSCDEVSENIIGRVLNIISPHFYAIMSMTESFELHRNIFEGMTLEQIKIMNAFDSNRVVLVEGMAGTGKSVLAVEKAKQVSKNRGDTLIICFNTYLKMHFKEHLSQFTNDIEVMNLGDLYVYHYKKRYDNFDIACQVELLKSIINNLENFSFENIFIDEAQDFYCEILDLLHTITEKKNGKFYAFYDINQKQIENNSEEWLLEFEAPRCNLIYNCRNTIQINESISKLNERARAKPNYKVHGTSPLLYIKKNQDDMVKRLSERMAYYHDEGVNYSDMVILSLGASYNLNVHRFEKMPVCTEDKEGHALLTTVRKYKGLESDIVFIIDIPDNVFESKLERNLFYIGLSRARHVSESFIVLGEEATCKFEASLGGSDAGLSTLLFEKYSIKRSY